MRDQRNTATPICHKHRHFQPECVDCKNEVEAWKRRNLRTKRGDPDA